MAALAAVVGLIGTAVSAYGAIQQGQNAKAMADYNAKVQEKQGSMEKAALDREALLEKRKGDLAMSRAQAVAAASGAGGAETPSVLNTITDIAGMSDYLQQSKIFEGTETKERRYEQAALSRARGESAEKESKLQAFATGMGGLYKYGQSFYG